MRNLTKLWALLALLNANTLFAQYSNATLNGQWLMHSVPISIGLDSGLAYIGFDGNGIITDCCTFGTVDGSTYSVSSPGGVISGTLITHGLSGDADTGRFSGQLTSQNYATLDVEGMNLGLSRILTPGALTDSLVGVLSSPVAGERNVTLRLDNQGQIISATGLVPPVSGRIYADSGIFAGHIRTGDNYSYTLDSLASSWDEFTIVGTYAGDSLNGELGLDGPRGYDPSGTVHLTRKGIATGVISLGPSTPSGFALNQNFPNPFNPSTLISYKLATLSDVTLKVYDVLGREVQTLVHERQTAGEHSVTFNAANLPSGVYFYGISAGTFTQIRKMVFLK